MSLDNPLQSLFLSNPQPMWIFRLADLAFLEVNDAAVALYGWSRDEFLRMRITDIRPPETVPSLLEEIGSLDETAYSPDQLYAHRKKDGSLLHVRLSAHGLDYGGVPARLVSVHDLTREQHIMQALREQKAFSQKVLDTMADGVVVCDREGAINYQNPWISQLLGLREPVQRAIHEDQYRIYHADGITPMRQEEVPLFRAITGEAVRDAEVMIVPDATRQPVYLRVNAAPLLDADGNIDGAVAVMRDITALRHSAERFRDLFDNAIEGIFRSSVDGRVKLVNPACARIFGYATPAELLQDIGNNVSAMFADATKRKEYLDELARSGEVRDKVMQLRRRDDTPIWVKETSRAIRDASGELIEIEGMMEDITDRILAEQGLRRSEERFARTTAGANDGIWDWNLGTDEIHFSDRWHEQLGLAPATLTSTDAWLERVHPDDRSPLELALRAQFDGGADHFEIEHRVRHANGSYLWMLTRGIRSRSTLDSADYLSGSQTDITVRKQAEERLQHDALHDLLTGLPNRALLHDHLAHAVGMLRREPDKKFALLYLDLDRFKHINDTLGHAVGDEALLEVTRRWRRIIREYDTLARLGGDEFALLLEHIRHLDDARNKAQRLIAALAEPIHAAGQNFTLGASVGLVYAETPPERPEDLLRDADSAMYRAKAEGRNQVMVFEPAMRSHVASAFRLETELRNAIAENALQLYYQPIVAVHDRSVIGYEALLRWPHPEKGLIPPMEFIPLAEETGLIVQLDLWVIDAACRQMAAWHAQGKISPEITVSINLSARQMGRVNLPEEIAAILARHGLDGNRLKVELTETALISNIDTAREVIMRLKDMGVGVVLDDFGTGYSSLSYLYQFPFDCIKVDRSFVRQLDRSENVLHLMELIRALGDRMRVRVVPEGVESQQELDRLQHIGFHHAQGYFFGRPMPPDEILI